MIHFILGEFGLWFVVSKEWVYLTEIVGLVCIKLFIVFSNYSLNIFVESVVMFLISFLVLMSSPSLCLLNSVHIFKVWFH